MVGREWSPLRFLTNSIYFFHLLIFSQFSPYREGDLSAPLSDHPCHHLFLPSPPPLHSCFFLNLILLHHSPPPSPHHSTLPTSPQQPPSPFPKRHKATQRRQFMPSRVQADRRECQWDGQEEERMWQDDARSDSPREYVWGFVYLRYAMFFF